VVCSGCSKNIEHGYVTVAKSGERYCAACVRQRSLEWQQTHKEQTRAINRRPRADTG
jgi:hypothetical protein